MLGVAQLNFAQVITAWVLGVMPLVIHPILKTIPIAKFQFMLKVNLEEDSDDNPFLRFRTKMNSKVSAKMLKYQEKLVLKDDK
jgi:hypothetical protein